ncbi:MAG TPA: glutamate--tRNA ligase [Caulobacteraceae bacterium]|nr:glutamate--tRNA ligase [Caulobacteraceae bacterium]
MPASDTLAATSVVTRIAPSPTGSMHIGNARAALFNWLYARHRGGRFLLRIEDTDRARHSEASVQVIFDSLKWLGLDWDGEPVFQFARADDHREVVRRLVEGGHAYRCYLSADEAEAAKLAARAAGHALRSPWRDRQPGAAQASAAYVLRFRVPEDGETVIEDIIRGTVRFPNKDLEDLVLLRGDGAPTYNLAVTVDDHDMGVTHVVRGEEHLGNAARQALIYRAMDWPLPAFAHLPLILGSDGGKLSKRHGAQSVGEFADMGYLPEALRNYLARLGWGHGNDEIFSDQQAIAWFDLKDVTRAAARLDAVKLAHVNNHYIRAADDARLTTLVEATLARAGFAGPPDARSRLAACIPLVKDGAKTIVELAELCGFALKSRPLELSAKIKALLIDETRDRLTRLAGALEAQAVWAPLELTAGLRAFADSEGVGLGKIGPALRGALSGDGEAPDLAGALTALGREESLGRIHDALSRSR